MIKGRWLLLKLRDNLTAGRADAIDALPAASYSRFAVTVPREARIGLLQPRQNLDRAPRLSQASHGPA